MLNVHFVLEFKKNVKMLNLAVKKLPNAHKYGIIINLTVIFIIKSMVLNQKSLWIVLKAYLLYLIQKEAFHSPCCCNSLMI